MKKATRIIGTGLATSGLAIAGLIGAVIGIGFIFDELISLLSTNTSLWELSNSVAPVIGDVNKALLTLDFYTESLKNLVSTFSTIIIGFNIPLKFLSGISFKKLLIFICIFFIYIFLIKVN